MYGYSKVKVGGKEYRVGDVIKNESGQQARVRADGTLQDLGGSERGGISINSTLKKAPAGTSQNLLATVATKFPENSVGGQCGDFVRKVVGALGQTYPRLGDSLKSKIAAVQKYGTDLANATIGSVIVTKENPTYGHVAYIIGQNEKGYIVAESNFKQSNKVSYGRVIPYNSSKVIGVINPNSKNT
jgi:surface antigen